MNMLTKRIMESVIVITAVLFFAVPYLENKHAEQQRDGAIDIVRAFNQAIWDRYEHGSKKAYDPIFHPDQFDPNPFGRALEADMTGNVVGCQNGFQGVDEAPDVFQKELDDELNMQRWIQKALDSGPYIAAPDEPYFATTEIQYPNFVNIQQMTKVQTQAAKREWLRGNHEHAVQLIKAVFDISDALRAEPALIAHLIRIAVYDIGIGAYNTLLLTNPNLEQTRLIEQAISNPEFGHWQYPDYLEHPLAFTTENYTMMPIDPDQLAALVSLNGFRRNEEDEINEVWSRHYKEDQNMLQEAGLVPQSEWTTPQILSYLRKWTTLPAMRKRAETLPAVFYQTDTLLSEEQARKIPTLFYATGKCRYNLFGFNFTNAIVRMNYINNRAQTFKAAIWARMQKEQTGKWLTGNKEFQSRSNFKDRVIQYVATDGGNGQPSLYREYIRVHNGAGGIFKPVLFDDSAQGNVPDPFQEGKIEYTFYISTDQRFQEYDYRGKYAMRNNDIDREQAAQWAMGILGACDALVESVTPSAFYLDNGGQIVTPEGYPVPYYLWKYGGYGMGMNGYGMGMGSYGMPGPGAVPRNANNFQYPPKTFSKHQPARFLVQLIQPKKTYWILHPGPNGVMDDYSLRYDPSNGTTSDGNIIQLVGWEDGDRQLDSSTPAIPSATTDEPGTEGDTPGIRFY